MFGAEGAPFQNTITFSSDFRLRTLEFLARRDWLQVFRTRVERNNHVESLKNRGFLLAAAMAVITVSNAAAQTVVDPPAAPIPVQILMGKRVFVSNGENTAVTGVPNLTYNEFYAYMKSWGRYELVPTPAEADLVFEIRFVAVTGGTNVVSGTSVGSSIDTHLRLAILDSKTHVVLWAFVERVEGANRQATQRKNYDRAMATLVDNVKKLATASPAATTDASAPDNQ